MIANTADTIWSGPIRVIESVAMLWLCDDCLLGLILEGSPIQQPSSHPFLIQNFDQSSEKKRNLFSIPKDQPTTRCGVSTKC